MLASQPLLPGRNPECSAPFSLSSSFIYSVLHKYLLFSIIKAAAHSSKIPHSLYYQYGGSIQIPPSGMLGHVRRGREAMHCIGHNQHHGGFSSTFYHFLSCPFRVSRVAPMRAWHKIYCKHELPAKMIHLTPRNY